MTKKYLIYSDGNYFPRAKKSGFGGYIQSPDGQILVEYSEQIRQSQYIYNFELLGIIRGLQLAQSMGLSHVISYCDEKTTMLRMNEIMANNGSVASIPTNAKPELFLEVVNLSKQFKSSTFEYIPRNRNKHSDALSRRYSSLMEQNFLRQYEEDLLLSESALRLSSKPTKRIFFSHPSLVKMMGKNNPFLVSPIRSRKARKSSRIEQETNYQYLFLEMVNYDDRVIIDAFYYPSKDEKIKIHSVVSHETFDINEINQFLFESIQKINIQQKSEMPLWIYTNIKSANNLFEQKEKLPKDTFFSFQDVYKIFNSLSRIMFHTLPFEHIYNPEIAIQEDKKKQLTENIDTIDSLIEQLEGGVLGRQQNKCFGKLIRYQLRSYKQLLSRELNEVEKQEIIHETTTKLENKGLLNLPNLRKTI